MQQFIMAPLLDTLLNGLLKLNDVVAMNTEPHVVAVRPQLRTAAAAARRVGVGTLSHRRTWGSHRGWPIRSSGVWSPGPAPPTRGPGSAGRPAHENRCGADRRR